MKPSTSIKNQRGDFLLESLIGMVLMAIIGMGIVHISSKANVAQHDMRMQEIVTNQMRAFLIKNKMGAVDICTTAPTIQLPNDETLTTQVQGCDSTTSADIGGITVTNIPRPISLSVDSAKVGGKIVVGGTWASI